MQRARLGLFVFVSSISLITLLLFGNVLFTKAQPSTTPRVWSIHPDMSMLSADTATYTVTFNQAVTGVDRNDFVVVDQTATIDTIETLSLTELRITVSNIASDYAPLLILVDDDTIVNQAGVPLGGIGLANGNGVSSGPAVDAPVPTQSKPPTNVTSLVAPRSGGINVGYDTSIKLTSAGVPVISYADDTYKDLKITICDTVLCGSPTVKVLDSTGWVGYFSSLALTSANIPIVSYADFTNADLKLAICSDAACSSVTTRTIDSDGSAGGFSSIALTAGNIPVISYLEESSSALRLAVCNNTACTAPTTTVIDVTDNVGYFTSIALTSAGLPVMSYIDLDNRVVKIATCDTLTCTTPVIQTVSDTVGASRSTSLALTSDDYPVVSYYDGDNEELRVINCSTTDCSSATVTTVDTTDNVGESTSITLTADEFPVISYYDTTNTNLKLAICTDATCTSPSIRTIDDEGSVGLLSSVALSSTDLPIVAYYDGTNQQVKLYFDTVVVDTGKADSVAKSSPSNRAIITTTSTTLSWATVANTNEYEYCIATSAAECTTWISTNVFGADPTSVALTDLSYNTTYYWQVRTSNAAGTSLGNNGTTWSFSVVQLPASFAKSAPANNATNQKTSVTLSWAASTRATSYEYCIALSTRTCTTWKSVGTKRTATVTGLTKNKAYYWQVRARNTGGTTLSSTTFWKFTTAR
jgi:hypothetical protein